MGFMLYAGHRVGAPPSLLGLFAIWVASPFVVLAVGHVMSKRWSPLTRATLHGVTPVVTVASLAIYGARGVWSSQAEDCRIRHCCSRVVAACGDRRCDSGVPIAAVSVHVNQHDSDLT